MENLFSENTSIQVSAYCIGERIDLKPFSSGNNLGVNPLVLKAGQSGCAVIIKYGAVVLFGLDPVEEVAFLKNVEHLVKEPYENPIKEETEITIGPNMNEGVNENGIIINNSRLEKIQIVATILAKSVKLDRYETSISEGFRKIEPMAINLKQHGKAIQSGRILLKNIGEALLIEHMLVNRVAVAENPEILWENPDIEPLYNKLAREYELNERRVALETKLELVSRTVETVIDLLNHKRSLRVEWYIVILIVIEILLTLYDIFFLR